MSVEDNPKENKKIIVLVEDKLFPLLTVLLSLQTILFVSNKQGLKNAPQNYDTQIKVLHLIDHNQTGDLEHFKRFERALQAREEDENNILKLDYQYEALKWDTEGYPKNCKQCANSIAQHIHQMCEGKEYAIILDAILLDSVDKKELITPQYDGRVLSQYLFECFRDHCIPYTNYEQETKAIRTAWEKGVCLKFAMFQRQQLVGNAIYKPFRDMLYKQLHIGGDTHHEQ